MTQVESAQPTVPHIRRSPYVPWWAAPEPDFAIEGTALIISDIKKEHKR